MAGTAFPLRFRQDRIRQLVREVAASEGISQNEFLEQAAEHELVVRGALIVDDLAAALHAAQTMSERTRAAHVEASIASFAAGEARPDPLRATQFVAGAEPPSGAATAGQPVIAAFRRR